VVGSSVYDVGVGVDALDVLDVCRDREARHANTGTSGLCAQPQPFLTPSLLHSS
jgi:hypothetical protein